MSVNTKIFVATAEGDIVQAVNLASKALDKFIRDLLDIVVFQSNVYNNRHHAVSCLKNSDTVYTNGVHRKTIDFNYDKPYFNIEFGCGEKSMRDVIVYSSSIEDNDVCKGEKVIFSFPCNEFNKETSVAIADVIASALHGFGDVYIDYNDCDSEDFFKVNC